MPEMAEAVPLAIRARRAVRDADFRHRGIASGEDDSSLVDFGIGRRRLRDALRRQYRRVVVAVDADGLVASRNAGAEMEDFAATRLSRRVAGLPARDGRHVDAAVGDGRGFGRCPDVRPHRHRDTTRRTARRVRPFEERFAGGPRGPGMGFRRSNMGDCHLFPVIDHGARHDDEAGRGGRRAGTHRGRWCR
jgi:hypothetical protein